MKHPPTPSQWRAVRETGRHLLVAAGAGTGKTHTVVSKILYLLGVEIHGQRVETPLRLSQIAAITYTNRAAADLKRKLREALRAEGLRREAYQVDLARIGTIHSFAGEVLRDFALRAGRIPATTTLDDGEGNALAAEVVRETLLEALDTGAVPGLDTLLADWSVRDVEGWVLGLVGESDRLRRLAAAMADNPGDGDDVPPEAAITRLALRALERLEAVLEERGAVDFDRMIVWTRDLLRQDAVRRALQRRIRVLFVDEFQDVDPVQKEIAYLLAEPESGRTDTPRLVLVGDPKQSIYRFRRADVTVWREVERDFREKGWGAVVALEENFRSVAPVLGFVDAWIGPILDEPLDGDALRDFEVPYRPVVSQRSLDREDGGPADEAVEILVVSPREDGKARKAGEIREAEAAAVARRMRELRGEGVAWSEMAVLLAGWGDLELYEAALRREGIPTYALRQEGFFARREVVDLVLALEAVRDPRDDRALFGFLRSPFVGLADETLLRIARDAERPYGPHLEAVADALGERAPDEAERLRRGAALLRRHTRLRDRLPTAELLRSLLEESGYLAHLALLEGDGDQRIANVRQFLRMARANEDLGVGDFLRLVHETRERGDRVGEARLHGEGDDVVVITSIHSSKGLEWPVVFWCDLIRTKRPDYGVKLLVGRDRMVLGAPDRKWKEQSEAWLELFQADLDEGSAETKRLWYVAATRAADRLILCGVPQGKRRNGHCPADQLRARFPELADADETPEHVEYEAHDGAAYRAVVRAVEVEDEDADAAAEIERVAAHGAEPEAPADAPAPGPVGDPAALPAPPEPVAAVAGRSRHSATEFLTHERCPRRRWFTYVMGLREPAVNRSVPAHETAVVRGQIVHDVLERLREEEELDRLLEDAIGRWAEAAPPPEGAEGRRYRDALREEIRAVADDPDYREIADRAGARRELPFLYIHQDGVYLQGLLDLAAPEGDGGVTILDVKTGGAGARPEDLAAKYRPQRDVYAAAVEGIGGAPVRRFAFQFSRAGGQVSEALDAEARAEARRYIGRVVEELRTDGVPDVTEHPAECEFCGFRRVGLCEGAPSAPRPRTADR